MLVRRSTATSRTSNKRVDFTAEMCAPAPSLFKCRLAERPASTMAACSSISEPSGIKIESAPASIALRSADAVTARMPPGDRGGSGAEGGACGGRGADGGTG
eukprot:1935670-Prymnesium_polylepis.1